MAGAGRGRRIGFPTANIATPNELAPRGVFITTVEIEGRAHPAVTNVGIRPTFGDGNAPTIEAHLLGLRRDLYGASVRIRFLKRIRGERTFARASELAARIREDAAAARRFFAGRPDMI